MVVREDGTFGATARAELRRRDVPGALLVGIGVGLTLPTLTAIAASSLPSHRFATGSAVITMARQVGFTLGVAILVAVLGRPHTAPPRLDAYRHGWEVIAALALAAAAAASVLARRPKPDRAEEPATSPQL